MEILKICFVFSLSIVSLFLAVYNAIIKNGKWLAIAYAALCLTNVIETSFYFHGLKSILASVFPVFFYAKECIELLVLPSFFLYLLFYYKKTFSWQKHLLPYLIFSVVFLILASIFEGKQAIMTAHCHRDVWTYGINLFFYILQFTQLLVYAFLIKNLLQAEQNDNFPFKKWHFILTFAIVGIKILALSDNLLAIHSQHLSFQIYMYMFSKAGILIGLFSLFFLELRYSFTSATEDIVKEKYQSSGLSDAQKNDIQQNIEKYLAQKPYLEAEFNLEEMATALAVPKNYISQVINQHYNSNFRELINKLRIEESLILLQEQQELNINQIYFEVGFNSKSVFNTAFKKHVGMTPTEYRTKMEVQ